MRGLGRLYNFGTGWVVSDMNTNNGETGKRCSLQNCTGIDIVVFKAVGTAGEDPTLTVKEHTAYTSGTSQSLAAGIPNGYHLKDEAVLDNDEAWVTYASTHATITGAAIADPGGAGTSAEHQQIVVIPILAADLSDGFTHVSLDYAVTASNAQLAGWIYVPHDLDPQRTPANLPNLLRPGVANA